MNEITSRQTEFVDISQVKCVRGFDKIQAEYPVYLSDESKLTMGPFDDLFFPKTRRNSPRLSGK